MGTPGDRTKIKEVIRRVSTQQSEQDQGEATRSETGEETPTGQGEPPTTTTTTIATAAITTTTASMTIFSPLAQFASLTEFSVEPSIKVEVEASGSGLEQARLEHYYGQSKFCSTEPYVELHKLQKQPKTFLSAAQPGPSGLQPARTKSSASTLTKLSPKRTKKSHACPVCQKIFQNPGKLAKHQLSHNGNSPYKCEHCKKTFSSKFKLVRHVLIHSDCKPFSCSVCERTFHRKDHLKNHIKVHSPSKKHYVCEKPNCKKEYTSLLSFKKHAALHAAEDGSLECQICSKTFETKDEILFHLKIHAGSRTVKSPNEKKFTCDHCDRKFFTRKDVRRHLVVHTGKRDFLCQFCPQRFGRKDHLVRHIKKSHSKNLSLKSEPSETVVKIEVPETSTGSIKSEVVETTPPEFPKTIPQLQVAPLFFTETFEPFTPLLPPARSESLHYLSGHSAPSELKDLGIGVLEDIGATSTRIEPEPELLEEPGVLSEQLMRSEEIMRLFQTEDDTNIPLPGFSQTFQSQTPQPPPQPPPQQ